MTDDQQNDVRDLTRKAGIRPTTTKARPGDALLAQLAPGERTFTLPPATAPAPATGQPPGRRRPSPAAGSHDRAAPSGSRGRTAGSHDRAAPSGSRGRTAGNHDRPATSGGRGHGSSRSPGTPSGAAAFSAGSRVGRRGGR
jgi:hypothetical protein